MARQFRSAFVATLAGETIPFTLLRMVGRRSVHLVIDEREGVQVRAPYHFAGADAEALVQEHPEWILSHYHQWLARHSHRKTFLAEGARLPFLGETLRLAVRYGKRLRAFAGPGTLTVVTPAPDEDRVGRGIERWYRREAGRYFQQTVDETAPALGEARPTTIVVRGQRTRWGSCSSSGEISLNWRLMLVDEPLARYVVVHELCHLYELNHGPRFWRRVARLVPDYREKRSLLSDIQNQLPF